MKPLSSTRYRYKDRHGNVRWYFRRHGKKTRIRAGLAPQSSKLRMTRCTKRRTRLRRMAANDCRGRNVSLAVHAVFRDPLDFEQLDPETQRVRRQVLEHTCQSRSEPGIVRDVRATFPSAAMTPNAVRCCAIARRACRKRRTCALKAIARVCSNGRCDLRAALPGVTQQLRRDVVRRPKENVDGGFHSWTPEGGGAVREHASDRHQSAARTRTVPLHRPAPLRRRALRPPTRARWRRCASRSRRTATANRSRSNSRSCRCCSRSSMRARPAI